MVNQIKIKKGEIVDPVRSLGIKIFGKNFYLAQQ